jgi:tyrosyl-tRNA synthetase
MSSSKDNLIGVEDTHESIKKKIKSAYCPPQIVQDNPIIQLYELYIFPRFEEIELERPDRYGGDVCYDAFSELRLDYADGTLHPLDVKNGAITYIERLVAPIRRALYKD